MPSAPDWAPQRADPLELAVASQCLCEVLLAERTCSASSIFPEGFGTELDVYANCVIALSGVPSTPEWNARKHLLASACQNVLSAVLLAGRGFYIPSCSCLRSAIEATGIAGSRASVQKYLAEEHIRFAEAVRDGFTALSDDYHDLCEWTHTKLVTTAATIDGSTLVLRPHPSPELFALAAAHIRRYLRGAVALMLRWGPVDSRLDADTRRLASEMAIMSGSVEE